VTTPPFVGPPPTPPTAPRVHQPQHVVHLILSVLTFGFWLLIWGMAAMNASAANEQERKRYDDEQARYQVAYDEWLRRYHQVYDDDPRVWR
jgi:hypothetical protein